MAMQKHKSVSDFLEEVGRARFERDLGHTTQVVSRAITRNQMPAHWYRDVRDWCGDLGVEVPEHLFGWSRPAPANKGVRRGDEARGDAA